MNKARSLTELVLIGNYPPDNQFSMRLYVELLADAMMKQGLRVTVYTPRVYVGRWARSTNKGLGKWLGYVDKYVLFPLKLRELARSASPGTVFQICDHSNAMYANPLRGRPVIVTCHDLLAVRGALGDPDAYCAASRAGRVLQHWILKNLAEIPFAACVSDFTRSDLLRLTKRRSGLSTRTILSPANCHFQSLTTAQATEILRLEGISINQPYILHVGSNLPRKNRVLLFRVLFELREKWPDLIAVFVGSDFSESERAVLERTSSESRVRLLGRVSVRALNALYCGAHAMIFPSFAEGFGWPVLEAQFSGCPVLSGNRTSLPEVLGAGGLLFECDDEIGMASALLELKENAGLREELISRGHQNTLRFRLEPWVQAYLNLYKDCLADNSNGHAA